MKHGHGSLTVFYAGGVVQHSSGLTDEGGQPCEKPPSITRTLKGFGSVAITCATRSEAEKSRAKSIVELLSVVLLPSRAHFRNGNQSKEPRISPMTRIISGLKTSKRAPRRPEPDPSVEFLSLIPSSTLIRVTRGERIKSGPPGRVPTFSDLRTDKRWLIFAVCTPQPRY